VPLDLGRVEEAEGGEALAEADARVIVLHLQAAQELVPVDGAAFDQELAERDLALDLVDRLGVDEAERGVAGALEVATEPHRGSPERSGIRLSDGRSLGGMAGLRRRGHCSGAC
jgi:hypothetical protein